MTSPILALLIVISFLTFSTLYIGRRLIAPLSLSGWPRRTAWGVLVALVAAGLVAPLVTMISRRQWVSAAVTMELLHACYLVLGFLSFVFTLVVLEDVLIALRKLLLWLALRLRRETAASFIEKRLGWFRRRAHGARLGRAVLVGAAIVLTAVSAQVADHPRVTQVQIPIRHLPLEFAGYRIVMLSDLHIGAGHGRDFVANLVSETNTLGADVVALVGDVADGLPDDLRKEYEPLRNLLARDAKLYVTGNHEYYWDAPGWMDAMRGVGFRVLHNEHHSVRRGMALLAFGGTPDVQGERFFPSHKIDLERTFAHLDGDGNSARILLAHQPRVAELTAGHRIALQLSGHTHGGQFFPWTLVVSAVQKWSRGLYAVHDGWIYVGLGAGSWGPPLRLGATPEIVLVELVPGG